MSAEEMPTDNDAFGKKSKSSSRGLVRNIMKDLAVTGRQTNLKSLLYIFIIFRV